MSLSLLTPRRAAGSGELPITWQWLGPYVVYYKLGSAPPCEHLLRVAAPVLCSLQLHCLSGGGTLVIWRVYSIFLACWVPEVHGVALNPYPAQTPWFTGAGAILFWQLWFTHLRSAPATVPHRRAGTRLASSRQPSPPSPPQSAARTRKVPGPALVAKCQFRKFRICTSEFSEFSEFSE